MSSTRPRVLLDRLSLAIAGATCAVLVPAACGGGGGGGGGSTTAPTATVRPIPSGRVVHQDPLTVEFATAWSDGGLATFLKSPTSGNGGLIGVHHGPTGEIDWTFEQQHQGLGWSFAGVSAQSSNGTWFTWANDVALVARIAPDGTIAAQSELELELEPASSVLATVVDGSANAYFVSGSRITRLGADALPSWAYRIEGAPVTPSIWHATDPNGGIVFGATLESGVARAASLAPNGTVRWSRELRAGPDAEVRVLRALVDDSRTTTLLVEASATSSGEYDLSLARIAPDGALTTRSLRPSGVASDAWGPYGALDVDGGRNGWIITLYEYGIGDFVALDHVSVDERGTVRWARRMPYTSFAHVSVAPTADGGAVLGSSNFFTDSWTILRCDAGGSANWTRSITTIPGAFAFGGADVGHALPAPERHARPERRFVAGTTPGSAELGLSFLDVVARDDGGATVSAGSELGRLFFGFDAAGASEWTANSGMTEQFVQLVRAPGAVAYATSYDQQTGFHHVMRLASDPNERWRVQIPNFTLPIPTSDGGVVASVSIGEAAERTAAWVSLTRTGASDATCVGTAEALPPAAVTVTHATPVWTVVAFETGLDYTAEPFVLEAATTGSTTSVDLTPLVVTLGDLCPL